MNIGAIVAGIIGEGIGEVLSDRDGLLGHPVNVTLFGAVEGLAAQRILTYTSSQTVALSEANILGLTVLTVGLHRMYRHLYLPYLRNALGLIDSSAHHSKE